MRNHMTDGFRQTLQKSLIRIQIAVTLKGVLRLATLMIKNTNGGINEYRRATETRPAQLELALIRQVKIATINRALASGLVELRRRFRTFKEVKLYLGLLPAKPSQPLTDV